MAGHYRVAVPLALLGQPEVNLGIIPGGEGTQRLPRLVGPSTALDMLFSAEPIDADNAFRIGLITKLVDKGQALTEAKRLVNVYEKRGPISLAFAKRAVHHGLQMDLASAIEYEFSLVTGIYGTDDKREGVAASRRGCELLLCDRPDDLVVQVRIAVREFGRGGRRSQGWGPSRRRRFAFISFRITWDGR